MIRAEPPGVPLWRGPRGRMGNEKTGDRRQETISSHCLQCAKYPPPALRATPASGGQAKPDDRVRGQKSEARNTVISDKRRTASSVPLWRGQGGGWETRKQETGGRRQETGGRRQFQTAAYNVQNIHPRPFGPPPPAGDKQSRTTGSEVRSQRQEIQ